MFMKSFLLLLQPKRFILHIMLAAILIVNPYPLFAIQENSDQIQVLTQKVSKDFSKKFCNGIGFGLSQESAFTFALKENEQAFIKKKGIKNINQDDLATMIATNIIEGCGGPINLSGQDGIKEFKSYYIGSKK